MSAGAGIGYGVNLFFFGLILLPIMAVWDYFVSTTNILIAGGFMDQDGANALFMLTILMNSIAFIFLVSGAYSMIVQAKSDSNKGV